MAVSNGEDPIPRDAELSELSRRERQIMEALLAREAATVQDIREAIPDAPSASAVRTFLAILERKGLISRGRKGRSNIYEARIAAHDAGRSAFRRVLDTFFGGSLEAAITAHLAGEGTGLSDDELKSAARLIEDARQRSPADGSSPDGCDVNGGESDAAS